MKGCKLHLLSLELLTESHCLSAAVPNLSDLVDWWGERGDGSGQAAGMCVSVCNSICASGGGLPLLCARHCHKWSCVCPSLLRPGSKRTVTW